MAKSPRAKYDVTPEQFVLVWESSSSAEEVAQRLKMPKAIVHARASNYRENGVRLKKMPRHPKGSAVDVKTLNEIVERVRAQKENDQLAPEEIERLISQLLASKKS